MTVIDEAQLRVRELEIHNAKEVRLRRAIMIGRLALLVGGLLIWEYGSGRFIDSLFVSSPSKVAAQLWKFLENGQLIYHFRFTLVETLAGYVIGAALGLVLAWIVSLTSTFQQILHPFLMAFYSIPKIALAPLIIMWFGLQITPKIVIAAIFVFFIVFMNTLAGIQSVSPSLLNVARVMGADNFQLMRKIVLPSAVPYIIMALRITVPQAMVGAIIGELLAGNRGVGYLINAASNQYNTGGVFAGIAALLVVVLTMDWLVSLLERKLMKWRPERPSPTEGTKAEALTMLRKPMSALVVVTVLAALAAAACSGSGSPGTVSDPGTVPSSEGALVPVKQAGFKVIDLAPIFIAEARGFFEAEGLDFEFVELESGKLGSAALLSGEVQFADMGLDDTVILQREGKDVILFYNFVNPLTMDLVMRADVAEAKGVAPDSPLEDRFQALRGLTIGITRPGAPTELYPRYFMGLVGLDPDRDAVFVPVGSAAGLMAAMQTRQIDAYMLSAPTPYILEKEGVGVVLIKPSEDVPVFTDFAFESVAVTRSFAQENPDVVRGYARAVTAATAWMRENPDEALQVLHDLYFSDTDLQTLEISFEALLPAIPGDGRITEQGIKNQISVLRELGVLEGEVDTGEGVLWTTEYLD